MIPLGYMAKSISEHKPPWLDAPNVIAVLSVSECVNDNVVPETAAPDLRNGFGLYNSPQAIKTAADRSSSNIQNATLFYYEGHDFERDGETWQPFRPNAFGEVSVEEPATKLFVGFDVVTRCDGPNSHSPLSCNSIAQDVATNSNCLLDTFTEAEEHLSSGVFDDGEPGPYQIYAVYRVDWPHMNSESLPDAKLL
jgi:hypothetical protein